jgi:NAD(P)H-dependent FMN reductase
MLNVGLIVGSTRPNRFADIPVPWLLEGASARRDLQLTVLDLREFRLPFLSEPASPMATGGVFSEPAAKAGCQRIGEFDAFVAIVAEYNHGPTAVSQERFRQRAERVATQAHRLRRLRRLWWGDVLKAARQRTETA